MQALTYMAMQPPGKLCGTREISKSEGIPGAFLGKVLLELRRAGLLRSLKGIGGGYALSLPPDRINLLLVVRCLAGEGFFNTCILDDHECTSRNECILHERWKVMRDDLHLLLEQSTVAEMARLRGLQRGAAKGAGELLPQSRA